MQTYTMDDMNNTEEFYDTVPRPQKQRTCAIVQCARTARHGVTLFKFPHPDHNPDMHYRWLEVVCDNDPNFMYTSNSYVCSLHFQAESLANLMKMRLHGTDPPARLILKRDAVPAFHLLAPHNWEDTKDDIAMKKEEREKLVQEALEEYSAADVDDLKIKMELLNDNGSEDSDPDNPVEPRWVTSVGLTSIRSKTTNFRIKANDIRMRYLPRSKYKVVGGYKCDVCDKKFKTAGGISYHLKTHTGQKDFICPFTWCGKKFILHDTLKRHVSMHKGEKNFSCDKCERKFITKYELRNHARVMHRTELDCRVCGITCQDKTILEAHLETHTDDEKLICQVCGKCFARRANLKDHMGIHRGDMNFKCDVCGKKFRRKSSMIHHKKTIHVGSDQRCMQCDKLFKGKRTLKEHMETHDGKYFLCHGCSKQYQRETNLSFYVVTGMGKNYMCHKCADKL